MSKVDKTNHYPLSKYQDKKLLWKGTSTLATQGIMGVCPTSLHVLCGLGEGLQLGPSKDLV